VGKTLYTSYSLFSTLGMCPRKWQLSRKYEPKVKAKALAEGDVFHQVLAKFYTQADQAQGMGVFDIIHQDYLDEAKRGGLKDDQIEQLEGKFEALRGILVAYWDKIAQHDLKRFKFLAIEKRFEIRLSRDLILHGYIDGLWEDQDSGVKYLVEHKYKTDHQEELMALDLQISLYTLAMVPEYGILPTLYNVARKPLQKRKAGEPAGAFARRVVEAINEELEVFQYHPTEIQSRFFVRQRYSRGKRDLEIALEQTKAMAKAMRAFERKPETIWRNVGEHCLYMCPFKSICLEEDPILVEQFYNEKYKEKSVTI